MQPLRGLSILEPLRMESSRQRPKYIRRRELLSMGSALPPIRSTPLLPLRQPLRSTAPRLLAFFLVTSARRRRCFIASTVGWVVCNLFFQNDGGAAAGAASRVRPPVRLVRTPRRVGRAGDQTCGNPLRPYADLLPGDAASSHSPLVCTKTRLDQGLPTVAFDY